MFSTSLLYSTAQSHRKQFLPRKEYKFTITWKKDSTTDKCRGNQMLMSLLNLISELVQLENEDYLPKSVQIKGCSFAYLLASSSERWSL